MDLNCPESPAGIRTGRLALPGRCSMSATSRRTRRRLEGRFYRNRAGHSAGSAHDGARSPDLTRTIKLLAAISKTRAAYFTNERQRGKEERSINLRSWKQLEAHSPQMAASFFLCGGETRA
jgi:hypothetical protein